MLKKLKEKQQPIHTFWSTVMSCFRPLIFCSDTKSIKISLLSSTTPQVLVCLMFCFILFWYEKNVNDIISSYVKIVMFLPSSLTCTKFKKNKQPKQLIRAECVLSELRNVKCDAGHYFTQFESCYEKKFKWLLSKYHFLR